MGPAVRRAQQKCWLGPPEMEEHMGTRERCVEGLSQARGWESVWSVVPRGAPTTMAGEPVGECAERPEWAGSTLWTLLRGQAGDEPRSAGGSGEEEVNP